MKPTDITIAKLLKVAKDKKYPININNTCTQFNLNIWGIRSTNSDSTKYDDYEVVFRKAPKPVNYTIDKPYHTRRYEDGWILDIFLITTNPGTPMLLKPMNPKGAAILVPGHYHNLFSKGYHKGDKEHPALIQYSPCKVYRDNNKNAKLDFDTPTETGMFGINNHRQSKWKLINIIGLNSAGCQVHFSYEDYTNVFMWLINNANKEGFNLFDYTLINEQDLL